MAVAPAIRKAFENHVRLLESQNAPGRVRPESEASFFVADLNDVVQKWAAWKQALPDVTPFFAVKSSYDRRLLGTLASCGAGFDCASIEEVELILSLGVGPERIIFTHPCKPAASLGRCRQLGVDLITFDSECELRKLHAHYAEARLVLRVFADDPTDADPLGTKFGAHRDDFQDLVQLAKQLSMQLAGASFHAAPSVAVDAAAYVQGVRHAAEVFAHARALGLDPFILDIGGGYTDATFHQIAAAVRPAIAQCFPPSTQVARPLRVLAEPGTLFSCSPFFLAAKVVARRRNATRFGREPATRLYINDGIYSNFMMHFIVGMTFVPIAVIRNGIWHAQAEGGVNPFRCSVWGRTCDSNDCVSRDCGFDRDVDVGDWLIFRDMGAYTTVCNTNFNGFTSSNHTIYLEPRPSGDAAESAFQPLRPQL